MADITPLPLTGLLTARFPVDAENSAVGGERGFLV